MNNMGILKQRLISAGYNIKERAYIYTGAIVGAAAPIIAARYLFFPIDTKNTIQELIMWGGSLAINVSTMIVKPHIPIPAYTAVAGITLGTLAAESSVRKRFNKNREVRLENKF